MASRRRYNIQPDNDNYSYSGNPGNNVNSGGGNNMNPGGGFNMNNLGQMLSNMDLGQIMGQLSQMMGAPQGGGQGSFPGGPQGGFQQPVSSPRDNRIQLLQALKPFLNPRRGRMIDNIGQLYNIARLLNGFNKKR